MSTGDDQPFGRSAPPPSSVFDDPTVQVSLSHQQPARARSGASPFRGRILDDESTTGAAGSLFGPPPDNFRPAAWTGDRPAPPFAAPGAVSPARDASVMERLVEGAYRWRSLLGLGLAGLMTVAIVVAYRGASNDEREDVAAGQLVGPTGISAGQDAAADSTPDTAGLLTPSTQVGSQVDEVTTTRVPAGPSRTESPGTSIRAAPSTSARSTTSGSSTTGSSLGSSTSTDSSSTANSAPTSSTTSSTTVSSSSSTTMASTTSTTAGSSTSQGGSSTTGSAPSSTTTPRAKIRLEAEEGLLLALAKVHTDYEGFSGNGYVGDIVSEGRGVTVTVDNAAGGSTPFRIRYAAGNDALPGSNRQLTLRVNGVNVAQVVMRKTASWTDWTDLTGPIDLAPGHNTITLVKGPDDSGIVNIDYIELN